MSFVILSAFVIVPSLLLVSTHELLVFDLGYIRFVGLLLVGTDISVMFHCGVNFAIRRRGTSAPFDPPKEMVTTGMYRIVRNPMYLGAEVTLA